MSTRLNNELREAMAHKAARQAHEEEEERISELSEALNQKRITLAEKAYQHLFSNKQLRLLESAPEGWFPTKNTLAVRLEYSNGGSTETSFEIDKPRRVPYNKSNRWDIMAVVEEKSPLGQMILAVGKAEQELTEARADLSEAKRETHTRVMQVLNTVTTTKKLVEVWPEALELIPEDMREIKVPALAIQELNKEIGLKAAQQEAA